MKLQKNLVIIIQGGGDIFYENISIRQFIENIGTLQIRDYKSLTRKTVFKFLDLEDEI